MRSIEFLMSLSRRSSCSLRARGRDVDLLLVLAADVSRSVDPAKFQLQRDGYAAAIANPRVLDAIRSGRTGRIAVELRGMVGLRRQRLVIDWTSIDDARSAQGISATARRSAALVRRPHLDQRRHRIRRGAARARAVQGAPPHHRRLRRRHQQCRPRRRARATRRSPRASPSTAW